MEAAKCILGDLDGRWTVYEARPGPGVVLIQGGSTVYAYNRAPEQMDLLDGSSAKTSQQETRLTLLDEILKASLEIG